MKNADDIRLTWYGHSCFSLEKNGFTIILDPFEDNNVPGYPHLRLQGDLVLCSHEHGDHNAVQCVKMNNNPLSPVNPFKITEIHSWHDDVNGEKRGPNTIRIFDDGKYRIAHMGDIGCMPSPEQKQQLKDIDVMLMPVGGFYTMDPKEVYALVQELQPDMMIPMHYREGIFGYTEIGTLDAFLVLCNNVSRHNSNQVTLPKDTKSGTVVLSLPVEYTSC